MSRGSRSRRIAMSRERQVLQAHGADDWDAPPVSAAARAAEAPVPFRVDPNPCHRYPWDERWRCDGVYSGSHLCNRGGGHAGPCRCEACGAEAEGDPRDAVSEIR